MVVHAFNPSPPEAEADKSVSLRPARSTRGLVKLTLKNVITNKQVFERFYVNIR